MSPATEHQPYEHEQQEDAAVAEAASAAAVAETVDADFVWLMKGQRGRRFVRRLLEQTELFNTSFNANAMLMARQEGTKQIGYWLLDQLERLCPAGFQTMMQEKDQ